MRWSPGDPWGDASAGRARETQGAVTGVRPVPAPPERRGLTKPQADLLKRLAAADYGELCIKGFDKGVYERLRQRGLVQRLTEGWGKITPEGCAQMEEPGW